MVGEIGCVERLGKHGFASPGRAFVGKLFMASLSWVGFCALGDVMNGLSWVRELSPVDFSHVARSFLVWLCSAYWKPGSPSSHPPPSVDKMLCWRWAAQDLCPEADQLRCVLMNHGLRPDQPILSPAYFRKKSDRYNCFPNSILYPILSAWTLFLTGVWPGRLALSHRGEVLPCLLIFQLLCCQLQKLVQGWSILASCRLLGKECSLCLINLLIFMLPTSLTRWHYSSGSHATKKAVPSKVTPSPPPCLA